MRIAFYLSYYFPHHGGVENSVKSLSNELIKNGFQITVNTTNSLGFRGGTIKKRQEVFYGTTIRRFPSINPPFTWLINKEQSLPLSPSLAMSTLTSDADIHHVIIPHQIIGEANALLSSMRKQPTLLTIDNFEVYKSKTEQTAFKLLTPFTNKMFDRVDGIIVKSEKLKRRYFSNRYANKVYVIKYGIETERFNPIIREKLRRDKENSGTKTILFVSVLDMAHQYKGLYWLLVAVKRLIPHHRNLHLRIVGSGALKDRYEAMVHHWNLEAHIHFLGRISDEQLSLEYYLADLFVLPSISELEGFGIVALEAAASGVPVIVSDICGVSEVVKELGFGKMISPFGRESNCTCNNWYDRITAIGIQPDYVRQIEDSILESLSTDWENQYTRVYKEICQRYSIQAYASKHQELYRRFCPSIL